MDDYKVNFELTIKGDYIIQTTSEEEALEVVEYMVSDKYSLDDLSEKFGEIIKVSIEK